MKKEKFNWKYHTRRKVSRIDRGKIKHYSDVEAYVFRFNDSLKNDRKPTDPFFTRGRHEEECVFIIKTTH